PGAHTGKLHLADTDSLPADQDHSFTFESGHPPKALILGGGGGGASGSMGNENGSVGSPAFFLRAALQAGAQAQEDELNVSGLSYSSENSGELDAAKLAQFKVL